MPLRKAGSNWVAGPERFFNREAEIEALAERARDGIHTLLTAQRRMGKTSLVRESLRRLDEEGAFETVFVDLEDATDTADAIAAMGAEARSIGPMPRQLGALFQNVLQGVADRVEEAEFNDLRVKLRAGLDAGNWHAKGNGLFSALAENRRPVVLAIDEVPIFVNRLLKGGGESVTAEGRQAADIFLSWLRRNGQAHRGQIVMILSGSVGLEPILRQAGLSAHANIYAPLDLGPWDEETATACLGELADTYNLNLSPDVCKEMCHRLRRQIPHHVQQFFDHLHGHLRRAGRREASLEDVESVYTGDMLAVRGQADMEHYESRLKTVLGKAGYRTALEFLTEAAVNSGFLTGDAIDRYRAHLASSAGDEEAEPAPATAEDVLYLLQHDGYLERDGDGYRFVSGLLEDWWRARHSRHFVPIERRRI